jgi:formamidopyrimidine-DNA glycosylase
MTNNSTLIIHLGMTGKLSLLKTGAPRAKHDHLFLLFDNGMELRLNDSRRFGSITVWSPDVSQECEIQFNAGIGIEPLSKALQPELLHNMSSNRKQPVKSFLMDSRKIAGIGNIYANEILFDARVHPLTPVRRISLPLWDTIIHSTRKILRQAIECGGSSISDFLGTSGNPGYFQLRFNVYNRAGESCRRCNQQITKSVLSGRATYYCGHCQPMNK